LVGHVRIALSISEFVADIAQIPADECIENDLVVEG